MKVKKYTKFQSGICKVVAVWHMKTDMGCEYHCTDHFKILLVLAGNGWYWLSFDLQAD